MRKRKSSELLELELFEVKFFDYRILSPDAATFLFIKYFHEELAIYEKLVRKNYYRNYLSLIPSNYKNNRHFRCFQDLRRWCDANFIKYKDFCKWAFLLHREFGFQKCYPNVFKNKKLLDTIKKIDKDKYKTQLKLADSFYFQDKSFMDTELQKEYWAYVFNMIQRIYPPHQHESITNKFSTLSNFKIK